jgi:geranylgeranyl transferase type-2 subunit alpha
LNNDLSSETLSLVTKILVKNPEFYTIWNHRRKLIQHLLALKNVDSYNLFTDELNFLVPLMMQFPKCYCIWNYRVWLLNQVEHHTTQEQTVQSWTNELGLVGKMLIRDERNFHGWNYRRLVVSQIEKLSQTSLIQSEFDYTTKMIKKALQNFSALHYRSKLIPRLLKERNATPEQRRQLFESELDLMQEALIDPFNQSAWFYHSHLMSTLAPSCPDSDQMMIGVTNDDRKHYYSQEIERIKEILEDFDDCKLVFQSLIQYCMIYRAYGNMNDLSTTEEIQAWLKDLERLDPMRSGRWEDFRINLHK